MLGKKLSLTYKQILENVFSGVYLVDKNRKITYWNKGAKRITGYTNNDVVGKSCSENLLMHVNDLGEVLCKTGCPLADAIKDGKDRESHVYLKHKNGYRLPVLVHASPLRDQEDNIIGAVETFSDSSSILMADQRIKNLSDELLKDDLT